MLISEQVKKLLNFVVGNAGSSSPLPMAMWSDSALDYFKTICVSPQETLGIKEDILISEAVHLIYFKYLRRIADDGALARYENFKSVSEVVRTCTETLLGSAEFERSGRTEKHIYISEEINDGKSHIFVDITNTYITGSRTGIQRVVREICSRLPYDMSYYLIYLNGNKFSYIDYVDGEFFERNDDSACKEVTFHSGDIYFDIDASWGDPISKWEQYSLLKKGGVRIINLHYDSVPLLLPDFSHPTTVFRYLEHFIATVTFSDQIFCISHAVKKDLEKVLRHIGGRLPKMTVIPMGGNYAVPTNNDVLKENEVIKFSKKRRFLLCVGTVEPRKNYSLLLKLLPQLSSLDINIIIVGKRGWESDHVLKSLEHESQTNSYFGWFSDVDDCTLETLYDSCFAYLTTSFYEGYGLPVMEALARKCIVISSDRGALPEAGNGLSLLFDIEHKEQLVGIVKKLVSNKQYYQKRKKLVDKYLALSWVDSATAITKNFEPYLKSVEENVEICSIQIVYISISPNNIRRSMQSFVEHAGTKRVLILTKLILHQEMKSVIHDLDLDGIVLCDEEVVDESVLVKMDHQEKNFALRSALYARNEVDELFIAADDDCILLRKLPDSFFLKNGKFIGRKCFPSMSDWQSSPFGQSSYDQGQWQTATLLKSYGFKDASYSAHQAQILNKAIACEIYREFSIVNIKKIDEWSIYFNIAMLRYSNKIISTIATTLYWPNEYSSWMPLWFNDDIYFENYYESNYIEGGPACNYGISIDDSWKIKLLHCKSSYDQYAFQRLLGTLLSIEPCVLTLLNTVNEENRLSVSNSVICALPGLWFRIPFEGSVEPIALGYKVNFESKLIVDGGIDVQKVSVHSGLMIKVPDYPGEFKVTIFSLEPEFKGSVELSLVVFPIRGIK